MRQQAWKMQIPPYGLKQRRRLQFRLPHRATEPNSESPPSLAGSRRLHPVSDRIHPGSNAAAVTPREPKFTKMGEGLSGQLFEQARKISRPYLFPPMRNP